MVATNSKTIKKMNSNRTRKMIIQRINRINGSDSAEQK